MRKIYYSSYLELFFLVLELINSISQNTTKTAALTMTTLAPVGVSHEYETHIPTKKQQSERIPEQRITDLNFLHTLIEESAGKMMSAEISSVPIILIPITIVSAVRSAITVLYTPVLSPVALEKVSSNVTAKILL